MHEDNEFFLHEPETHDENESRAKVIHEQSDTYYLVKIKHSNETCLCMPLAEELKFDDRVVIETKYGNDLAQVLGRIKAENSFKWDEVHRIIRIATSEDVALHADNELKAAEAFRVCREKIAGHQLDMKLISVHYVLGEPRIIFFFTSENRVDFRELVRDLVSVFHQRIELRQIGVRDESRIVGGKAVCGRGLCCNTVSDKLQPVSIKMAKIQNLSLNSMKISGPCGRLLCCLSYEYEAYRQEKRELPGEGCVFNIAGTSWRVREVNILSRTVLLGSDDGRHVPVEAKYFRQEGNYWKYTLPTLEELDPAQS